MSKRLVKLIYQLPAVGFLGGSTVGTHCALQPKPNPVVPNGCDISINLYLQKKKTEYNIKNCKCNKLVNKYLVQVQPRERCKNNLIYGEKLLVLNLP